MSVPLINEIASSYAARQFTTSDGRSFIPPFLQNQLDTHSSELSTFYDPVKFLLHVLLKGNGQRVLSIEGPPKVGKTCLMYQVASQMLRQGHLTAIVSAQHLVECCKTEPLDRMERLEKAFNANPSLQHRYDFWLLRRMPLTLIVDGVDDLLEGSAEWNDCVKLFEDAVGLEAIFGEEIQLENLVIATTNSLSDSNQPLSSLGHCGIRFRAIHNLSNTFLYNVEFDRLLALVRDQYSKYGHWFSMKLDVDINWEKECCPQEAGI
jgi:hypothetical protein